jgi:hypothetical protein
MDSKSRSALIHVIIAKSVIEALLIGALTVSFFFVAFPPYFQGWGEATPHTVAGWVVNYHDPWQRVEVQLFIDDRFVSASIADRSRPDLITDGVAADEWHGYSFDLPPLSQGLHTARVYAVHSSARTARKSLQLVGDPISFSIDADGTAHWLPRSTRPNWFSAR